MAGGRRRRKRSGVSLPNCCNVCSRACFNRRGTGWPSNIIEGNNPRCRRLRWLILQPGTAVARGDNTPAKHRGQFENNQRISNGGGTGEAWDVMDFIGHACVAHVI